MEQLNPSKQTLRKMGVNNSNFGEFNATIESRSKLYHYAKVSIDCCNHEFHMRLVKAVQPILDELTIEMNELMNVGEDDE